MPFDGNGNYSLPTPQYPAITGAVITADNRNTIDDDLANALSNVLCRDGQSVATANLPMGGFKHTGLGAGTAAGDSIQFEQLYGAGPATAMGAKSKLQVGETLTTNGVGTAYTLTPLTALTAYASGATFDITFHAASGASPTLNVSGLGATVNLVKQLPDGSYANIAANDIPANHRSRVTLLSATQAWVEKLPPPVLASGTAVTASGTAIDFTGIPSWVKRVTVMFADLSTNGTSHPLVQIGAGSVKTSGYAGVSASVQNAAATAISSYTTGFGIPSGAAANQLTGSIELNLVNATTNLWQVSGNVVQSVGAFAASVGGYVALSGALDRVRLTTVSGANTFDLGSINILYE